VIADIRNVTRAGHREMSLAMGAIVFERVFGRSAEDAEKGERNPTFVLLAADPSLPVSPTTLWRNVNMYLLVRRIPWAATSEHLGVAHLRAVLGLPHLVQQTLLAKADDEKWTKATLEAKAGELRTPRKDGRGRPRTPTGLRALREVVRALDKVDVDALSAELLASASEDAQRARDALTTLQTAKAGLLRITEALGARDPAELLPRGAVYPLSIRPTPMLARVPLALVALVVTAAIVALLVATLDVASVPHDGPAFLRRRRRFDVAGGDGDTGHDHREKAAKEGRGVHFPRVARPREIVNSCLEF
jgi:hypothetical protein